MIIRKTSLTIALALSGNIALADVTNETESSFKKAVKESDVSLSFRYRIESVDQDNLLENAMASTLKTRLTINTKPSENFKFLVEFDDVRVTGSEDKYNSLTNGVTTHSVVADPEATELNQAVLSYTGFNNTTVNFGRQRVNLDNQRFVGGVAWRQNEQTHDGITISNKSIADTTITYGFVKNVNSILDSNVETSTHLFNYHWSGSESFSLTGYGYFLDLENAAAASTQTLGLRAANSKKTDSPFSWTLEYASQSDYADNPISLDASYIHAKIGYQFSGWKATIGNETLSSNKDNQGGAFQTILGTKHKFQGWADLFLNTPDNGIEDTYLSIGTQFMGNKFVIFYHDFNAETGNASYGTELDMQLSRKISNTQSIALKYANYDAEDFGVDTTKIWFTYSAAF